MLSAQVSPTLSKIECRAVGHTHTHTHTPRPAAAGRRTHRNLKPEPGAWNRSLSQFLSVAISVSCVSLVTEGRLKVKISDLFKRKRFENNFVIIDITAKPKAPLCFL